MDYWDFSVCIIIKILLYQVRSETVDETIDETTEDTKQTGFIIPEELSETQDLFVFENNLEYIVSSKNLRWEEALLSCKTQLSRPGLLATIDTEEKALFLAEALSETNKILDNLWIAGVKRNGIWTYGFNDKVLSVDLLEKYNQSITDSTVSSIKDCLSFRRSFHLKPGFVELNCYAERPYVCERSYTTDKALSANATHPGWIKLGKRLYKIFYDRTTWENATEKCYKADQRARLAVIANYVDAQNMGRYLLVGRPALENAWIGAKYDSVKKQFVFDRENIALNNTKDNSTNYPPWLEDGIRKKDGCLLLDRHIGNTTLFIEARCERLRPYICYKFDEEAEKREHQNQFGFNNADYIFYFNRSNFEIASKRCSLEPFPGANANGKLATPKNSVEVLELLSIMGENITTSQHIWIGGKMLKNKWSWLKKRTQPKDQDEAEEDIPMVIRDGYPPWVINGSYTEDVENMNVCLNMDRENHKIALFYGTDCSYPQNFICEYPKGTLTNSNKGERSTESPVNTEMTESTEVAKETTENAVSAENISGTTGNAEITESFGTTEVIETKETTQNVVTPVNTSETTENSEITEILTITEDIETTNHVES